MKKRKSVLPSLQSHSSKSLERNLSGPGLDRPIRSRYRGGFFMPRPQRGSRACAGSLCALAVRIGKMIQERRVKLASKRMVMSRIVGQRRIQNRPAVRRGFMNESGSNQRRCPHNGQHSHVVIGCLDGTNFFQHYHRRRGNWFIAALLYQRYLGFQFSWSFAG